MKKLFALVLFLWSIHSISAQEFIIRQSDSAGCFSFVDVRGGKIARYKGSYDVLQKSQFNFMTNWGISEDHIIYWTNGENIYKYNFVNKNGSSLVYSHLYWILEFFVRGHFIYIIYNPTKQEGPYDNRYLDGIKFCRINRQNGAKEDLRVPPGYNVTNLTISTDEKWASFINTKGDENAKYGLILYDLLKGKIKIIDTASFRRAGSFGDADKVNSAYWADSNTLLYYKDDNKAGQGLIITYNLNSKSKSVYLKNFPERDFTWFSFNGGYFYCSSRNTVYKTRDGIKQETVFEDDNLQRNVLAAAVLRF